MIITTHQIYIMPGMSFRQPFATRDAPAQVKEHKQFNFTLQPLVGVEQNIRDMIQPEDSQPLQEISKTFVSDNVFAFPTSSEERQRPKRKAPVAPVPSAKFVSSPTEFKFGRDENANHNVRSTYEPQPHKPIFKKPKMFQFEDSRSIHDTRSMNIITESVVSPNTNVTTGTSTVSNMILRSDIEASSTSTSKSENDNVELDRDEDITNPILDSKFANGRIHVVAQMSSKNNRR